MAAIIYNSKPITPAPLVTIKPVNEKLADGRNKRKYFEITLNGKMHAFKGSPNSAGAFGANADETITMDSRLTSLLSKQAAIAGLFSQEGLVFEIQGWDGAQPTTFHPQIQNITFQEGIWTEVVPFQVTMQADEIKTGDVSWGGGTGDVGPEETWTFEVSNENTRQYRVTHTITSQQLAHYADDGSLEKKGWEVAKTVVLTRVGAAMPTGMIGDISGLTAGNYGRSENINEAGGSYSITETYYYNPNGDYTEEFNVSTRVNEGQVKVSVEGTITGFAAVPPATGVWNASLFSIKKYMAASGAWTTIQGNLLTRAQNYSGYELNPTVLNKTKGDNPVAGVITFNWEYDNRPTNEVTGALSETISVNAKYPTDVFASIVVLGRLAGPVLQDIDTVTASVKTVSIEAVMPPQVYGGALTSAPNTDALVLSYAPTVYTSIFTSENQENFVRKTGRYTRTYSWTFV